MEQQAIIEWMKNHSPQQSIVLGVDGYARTPEFDAFFKKHYTHYFASRITLLVMLLLSEEEAKIYLNNEPYDFKQQGLMHLAQTIGHVMADDKQQLDIVFSRRIPDTIEYPEFERTYQYLLFIGDLTNTAFYHVPQQRQEYIEQLVDKMNLSLK